MGLLGQTLIVVIAFRLGITFFTYNKVRRWMPALAPVAVSNQRVVRIAWAVGHMAKLVPGASCLTQALATQWLLARAGRPCDIRIGVAQGEDGKVKAHAWVVIDDRVVIGGTGTELQQYTALADLGLRTS